MLELQHCSLGFNQVLDLAASILLLPAMPLRLCKFAMHFQRQAHADARLPPRPHRHISNLCATPYKRGYRKSLSSPTTSLIDHQMLEPDLQRSSQGIEVRQLAQLRLSLMSSSSNTPPQIRTLCHIPVGPLAVTQQRDHPNFGISSLAACSLPCRRPPFTDHPLEKPAHSISVLSVASVWYERCSETLHSLSALFSQSLVHEQCCTIAVWSISLEQVGVFVQLHLRGQSSMHTHACCNCHTQSRANLSMKP